MVVSRSLFVVLHDDKIGDAIENDKYVIYMKKGALAQPKNTQM